MNAEIEIRTALGNDWPAAIYAAKVRTQRTRSLHIDVPQRENEANIQYTLLGIELKVGKRRFACPDLATARYMRVFARIGVRDSAVPYNITKISVIADELETAWQRVSLLASEMSKDLEPTAAKRLRGRIIKALRSEFIEIGAGESMPTFDQKASTRRA